MSVPVFHSFTWLTNRRHTHSHDYPPPTPDAISDSPGKGTCFSRRTLHTNLNSISSQFRLFSCSHVVPSGLSWLDQPFHFTLNSSQQLLSFRASSRLPLSCPACAQQPLVACLLNMTLCFDAVLCFFRFLCFLYFTSFASNTRSALPVS